MFDKLKGERFWSSSCHTFEGRYGVAKIKFTCHWEPVEFFKKGRDVVVFARTTFTKLRQEVLDHTFVQ